MKKGRSKKEKIIQSLIFICLSLGTVVVIVELWDFLYQAESLGRHHGRGRGILYTSCVIPLGLLYGAIAPWVNFEGFKEKVTGGQLMRIDKEGCYHGPIDDFDAEEVKALTRIFNRESDWRYERFSYSQSAVFLKTTKGGQWFFPDQNDRRLIMTGSPAETQLRGFKISEEDSRIMDEIISKHDSRAEE